MQTGSLRVALPVVRFLKWYNNIVTNNSISREEKAIDLTYSMWEELVSMDAENTSSYPSIRQCYVLQGIQSHSDSAKFVKYLKPPTLC